MNSKKRKELGSRTGLVMQILSSSRPLVPASLPGELTMTKATLPCCQADSVLFLITKPAREPRFVSLSNVLEDKQTMSCFLWKLEKLCSGTDSLPRSIPSEIDAYPRGLASISVPLVNNR